MDIFIELMIWVSETFDETWIFSDPWDKINETKGQMKGIIKDFFFFGVQST